MFVDRAPVQVAPGEIPLSRHGSIPTGLLARLIRLLFQQVKGFKRMVMMKAF